MASSVLLPLSIPDTAQLRKAVATIIRDIQGVHGETDQKTADRLGVHKNTISAARNELSDLGALTIARIGAVYGEDALSPWRALYAGCGEECREPMTLLADAMAAIARAKGPKGKMDALPAIKDCIEGLSAFVLATERDRLRLVS